MAISFINQATATATSLTYPTGIQAGDYLIYIGYRTTTSAPSLPSGYTSITNASGDLNSVRASYKVAAGTESGTTSPTSTNATQVMVLVYRNVAGIGASATHDTTTSPGSIPALTLQNNSGNSWVVGFMGSKQGTSQSTPGTLTNRAELKNSTTSMIDGYDTNGGVSSWSAASVTLGSSTDTWGVSIELKRAENPPNPPNMIAQATATAYGFAAVGATSYQAAAQTVVGTGAAIAAVEFYLSYTSGSPSGNAVAKIYAMSGTYGTSGIPSGSALATSDNFNAANVVAGGSFCTLTFSGSNQITLTNGTDYMVSFEYSGSDVHVGTLNLTGQNYALEVSSSWSATANEALGFYLLATANTPTSTTPELDFSTTDPEGDAVSYEVQLDTSAAFGSQSLSVVQRNSGAVSGTTPLSVAFSSNNTAGNSILVIGFADDAPGTFSSFGDSQGNTYSQVYSAEPDGLGLSMWIANNIKSGANTVSATIGAADNCTFHIYEINTNSTNLYFDAISAFTSSASTSPVTSGSINTNFSNELLIGLANNNATGGPVTWTAGSGYSNILQASTSQFIFSATEEQVVSNTGTYTAGLAWSGGNGVVDAYVAGFYAGAPLIDALSASGGHDAGQFSDITNPSDTDPFPSGDSMKFVVPSGETLTASTTYYWRARAIDPSGTNTWGSWSATYSFTPLAGSLWVVNNLPTPLMAPLVLRRRFPKSYLYWSPGTSGSHAYTQSLTAGVSFTGLYTKITGKRQLAGLSFTGAQTKAISKPEIAAVTFTGSYTKRDNKALNAGVSFTGSIGKATAYLLGAAVSFIGSFTTALVNLLSLTAALSFTGNYLKAAIKPLVTAGVSFTGSQSKSTVHKLTANMTFTGSLVKSLARALAAASLTFTGSIAKQGRKALAAGVSFLGSFLAASPFALVIMANLGFTGSQTKRTSKTQSASVTFTGSIVKLYAKLQSAALTFTGTFSHIFVKLLTLTSNLTFTGAQFKEMFKALAGTWQASGSVKKSTNKSQSAGVSFMGSITRSIGHALQAALTFTGSILTGGVHTIALTASVAFSGLVTKRPGKSETAGISFAGSETKRAAKSLSGGVAPSGGITKSIRYLLSPASLSFVGSIGKMIGRAFAAVVSFVGSFTTSSPQQPIGDVEQVYVLLANDARTVTLANDPVYTKLANDSLTATLQNPGVTTLLANDGPTVTLSNDLVEVILDDDIMNPEI